MKCKNCGTENLVGTEKCTNCGFVFNQKNKKKNGIIIFLIILLILIGAFIFWKEKINKFKDPFTEVNMKLPIDIISNRVYEEKETISGILEEEYKSERINADKYIKELAYSFYDYDKLDYKYKNSGSGLIDPNYLIEKAAAVADSLSPETARYIISKISLADVKWDVKSGTSGINNFDQSIVPLISEQNDLSKLSKAVLSSNGNFIIYYTTSGANAIKDSDATKIADHLENTVKAYEDSFGFKFTYTAKLEEWLVGEIAEVISFRAYQEATTKAEKVLKDNNINIDYMKTAMPVFIIDTNDERTLGYYISPSLDLFEKIMMRLFGYEEAAIENMLTTYSFPYFTVSSKISNFDDAKLVISHELFHHYEGYNICGNGDFVKCASGNFTTETMANFAAVVTSDINKTDTVINDHARHFIANSSTSLDKIGVKGDDDSEAGYNGFVFALNYAETVKNGRDYLFNSLKTTEPLKFLAESAGADYKKVMILTGKRNLTADYSNKIAIAKVNGVMNYPQNYRLLDSTDQTIDLLSNYSSFQYFYVDPSTYKQQSQIIFKNKSTDLSLLLFVKENGTYKYLYTHEFNKDFVINVEDFRLYKEVVFGLVNTSYLNNVDYTIEVKETGKLQPTVTAKGLKLDNLDDSIKNSSSASCYKSKESDNFYTINQMMVGFDSEDILNELYAKVTLKIKDVEKDNPLFPLTQKMVSGLLQLFVQAYKEQFKYFDIITNESDYEYSVTIKVNKNFYDTIKSKSMNIKIDSEEKVDVIRGLYDEGYTCEYQK
ncbi:MAG: zinc ribbon domain-containing protein [Mollicutes bacterium]|nr:zinc ribbon domain-containing protein [Mollicutes bacterium]